MQRRLRRVEGARGELVSIVPGYRARSIAVSSALAACESCSAWPCRLGKASF